MLPFRALVPCLATALSGLATALSCLACAPVRAPAIVEIGPAGAALAPPEGSVPEAEAQPPKGPGCSWETGLVSARGDALPLCFAVDSACFARLGSPAQGRVTVPAGDPAASGARASFLVDGIRLEGWTFPSQILLSPQVPVVLGGVAIPWDGTHLQVERVGRRAIDFSMEATPRLHMLRGNWRAHVPCASVELTGERPPMEAIRAAVKRPGQGDFGEGFLPVGQAVRIAAEPGGADMAEVTVAEGFARVEVLDVRQRQSFVLWWDEDMVYFGWVESAVLSPAPISPIAHGAVTPRVLIAPAPLAGTRCPADVPLYAEVLGTREEVGAITGGVRFDLAGRSDGFTQVYLRTTQIDLEDNSRWLVKTESIAGCRLE